MYIISIIFIILQVYDMKEARERAQRSFAFPLPLFAGWSIGLRRLIRPVGRC